MTGSRLRCRSSGTGDPWGTGRLPDAISAGAIGIKHIEASALDRSALDRIVALLVPGGLLVVTLNERAMEPGQGIAEKFQALQTAGTLIPRRIEIVDYHLNEGIKGWLGIFQVAAD